MDANINTGLFGRSSSTTVRNPSVLDCNISGYDTASNFTFDLENMSVRFRRPYPSNFVSQDPGFFQIIRVSSKLFGLIPNYSQQFVPCCYSVVKVNLH